MNQPTPIPHHANETIELRQAKALAPYARNARTHTKEQVMQVADSIRRFRWTNPILIDEADGIVAGHGRVLAAHDIYKNGETIITVGGSPLPHGMVPVIVARGWSTEEKKAYVIADNRLALNAGWDETLLRLEMIDLKAMDFPLGLMGFSEPEIDVVFNGWDPDPNRTNIDPELAAMMSLIKVYCHGKDAAQVVALVTQALAAAAIEDAKIVRG